MSKFKTDVVYKIFKEKKGNKSETGSLYFKNVPVVYAQVLKPAKKYKSEELSYQMVLFINPDTMAKLEKLGVNKEMAEVGVTKIKQGDNRGNIKYDPAKTQYAPYAGMFGAQFSRDVQKRDGTERTPVVVLDSNGEHFTQNVGNGSICNVKMFARRNEENMLVVMLDTIVVLDHVPYEGGGNGGYDEELGVSVPAKKASSEEEFGQESSSNFDDDEIDF